MKLRLSSLSNTNQFSAFLVKKNDVDFFITILGIFTNEF